jgi:outer membrane protein TolC
MLPWFGTVAARENYAGSMAETEFVEITIPKRKLAMSVAQSYYQLFALRAKQEVLEENIILLNTYEELALTSVEVGNASAVDVLRLQIRRNELIEQMKVVQEEYIAQEAAFNNMLNRKQSMAVATVSELELPPEDQEYTNDSLDSHSELLKYDKLFESIIQFELLNQKERAPNIGFGLDYVPVSERTDMDFDDNGKDIFMPMVSVSIPVFSNKYRAVSRQNELRQMEIRAMKEQRLNVLKSAYAIALARRNQARIQFSTQDNNLKNADDAEDILLKNYETGTIDFNDILEIQELKLKFGLERIEAVRKYYEQSAIINYLVN